MMFKLSLFVTSAAADWHNTGSVDNQITATRAAVLAQEWMDSCATRPEEQKAACRGQCVTALAVAGCESEWDSMARNPTGCNGNQCMGVLQVGCQWLSPDYACKDLAAEIFTKEHFTTCSGPSPPATFTAPVLDSALMQMSQCLLENVDTSRPYSEWSWQNQWACASSPTDPHYIKAKGLAETACAAVSSDSIHV
jgi:hypothetical protein